VQFISGRILDQNLQAPLSKVIDGFNKIADLIDQGVPVRFVTCAFGMQATSQALQNAVNSVTSKGVVVFAGMGRWSGSSCNFIPACFGDPNYPNSNPNVISVGALNATEDGIDPNISGTSDILAPQSARVVSFLPGSTGASFSGFSAATGVPAGIFALTLSYATMSWIEARERVKFAAAAHPVPGARFGIADAWLAATSTLLLVGSATDANLGAGLDSVTALAGPFGSTSNYFFKGMRATRLALFAYNLELTTGDGPSAITATARDVNGVNHNLVVEFVGTLPNQSFLEQVTVLLAEEDSKGNVVADNLAGLGQLTITITYAGQVSNPVIVIVQ
jgi:hypothetical protein